VLRFGSPFFLDFISHPGSGPPITAWGLGHSYQDSSLSGLGKPNSIAPDSPFVFDELYFANDAKFDLQGKDYLDPEPPLGKLLIALGIKLFGFNSFGWRFIPALFGTALIPIMYLLARQLLSVRFFAVAAGVLAVSDGMLFVESRTAVLDIFPTVLLVAAYLAFHLHLSTDDPGRRRWAIAVTGLIIGLAVATKWTTLAAFAVIVVILVARLLLRLTRYDRKTAGIALLSLTLLPAFIYVLSFTRYLMIPHYLTGFASPALSLAPVHLDLARAVKELVEFHRWTFNYHYTLRACHPFYSPWFSWPFLFRPVAFYERFQGLGLDQATGQNLVAEIFNLGNPLIWWATIPAMVATAGVAVRKRIYAAGFIVFAFLAAWLPLSLIPRGLFLYHMMGGLPFMILAVAFCLTLLRPLSIRVPGFPSLRLGAGIPLYAYLAMVVCFFFYFYPLWTGLPLSYDSWNEHIWVPTWLGENCPA
jgi:dolichyl-phosphate-mannose--protein O-mannosyl transferase